MTANMYFRAVEERWLKQGCWKSEAESNDSMTICYCNHLTNFAVLMDIYGVQVWRASIDARMAISRFTNVLIFAYNVRPTVFYLTWYQSWGKIKTSNVSWGFNL